MQNGLMNWTKYHSEEVKTEKEKAQQRGKKTKIIADGESIILMESVKDVTDSVFTFNEGTPKEQKVKRFFYWTSPQVDYVETDESTYPLLVPKSVHFDVIDLIEEYKDKLTGVKVKKSGKDIQTEYKVFPILE